MRMKRLGALILLIVGFTAVVSSGCSSGLKLEDLQTSGLAGIPEAASSLIPVATKTPVGSATEVYTRVARGVLTCWMGAHGSLKGTHLFQAEAQPRTQGGAAEINVHERIKNAPNQPGRKVFSVSITPVGDQASVVAENLALPREQGDSMREDVERWAANEEGCLKTPITEGWTTPSSGSQGTSEERTQEARRKKQ